MHTYESWLYKNYRRPLKESDTNGLIVAFDPTRKNALLHQQVTALQERFRFDRRVISKIDSYASLLATAKEAWREGYEHLAVLTSAERLSEVDSFLQERCGQAFESIQVVPENSPRLYEAPQPQVRQQVQQPQQPQQPQQKQPPKAKTVKPVVLFLIQMNPPLSGMKTTLVAGHQMLNNYRGADIMYALHDTGIPDGYILGSRSRDVLLRGDGRGSMPTLYGKDGVNPIDDPLKMNDRSSIYLSSIQDISAALLKSLPGRDVQKIIVPQNMYNVLVRQLGSFPQDRLDMLKTDNDTFTGNHKSLIDLGRKITKDCPKDKEMKQTREFKNISLDDPRHLLAVHMLSACTLSMTMSGERLDKQLALSWGELDASTKAFLSELGAATGVGDIVSGVTDIVKTIGSVVKRDEVSDAEKAQAYFRQLENMPFDTIAAMNHPDYEKFVQQLDLV